MLDTLAKWIAQCAANPHIAFYEEDFVDVHQRLAAAGGSDSGIEAEAKELIRIVKSIDKKHVEAVARIRAAAGMQPLQVSFKGASQLGEATGTEFADAVRVFNEAFAALPGEDPRALDIGSRASAPLAAETPKDKQGAVALLSGLQAEASKLTTTIGEEHKSAVGLYQEAMKALPPEEARVQHLASRAEGPLGATLAKDQASATRTLTELTEEAGSLVKDLIEEHPEAVRLFQEAVSALPSADLRRQNLESRATSALKATEAKDVPAAVVTLSVLIEEARKLDATMVKELADAVREFQDAVKPLPADDTRVKAILDKSNDPISKTTAKDSADAIKALNDLKPEIEQAKLAIADDKTKMLEALALLTNPDGATEAEQNGMKAERDRAATAMSGDWPSPADFAKAQRACDALATLIRTAEKVSALAAKSPKAAAKARESLASFDAIIGEEGVTPELVAKINENLTQAREDKSAAISEWHKAKALPEDNEEQIAAKELAVKAAVADYRVALQAEKDASKINNAIIAKEKLSQSLAFGPLAPDAGRPFKDSSAEKLIAAYQKDPLLADSVIDLAQRSRDPDQIAKVIAPICNQVARGFKAGGKSMSEENARIYAENLLKSGDHIGPDFYAGIDSYLKSGRQFETGTLGPLAGTFPELATERSKALGGAMLAEDGTFDPTSDKAKNAIADLMYNPDILRNATPSLALHAFETQKALQNGATKNACEAVINGVKTPSNSAGTNLVCKTMGVTAPLTDTDARQAVLSAFFTPMDQGPVGSCFTTAPARRLRHEKPEEALKGFAEIAGKGTFTSATGLKVPAVTKLNEGGNPLIQSWEFSVASAAATQTGSRERNTLRRNLFTPNGLGKVIESVAGTDELKTRAAQANLRMAIGSDFNFQYDPTSKITDSSDGSSSTGRYRIQPVDAFGAPKGDPITTKEQFIAEMTESALKALSVDKTSTEGLAIIAHIKSDAFINAVCPGKYKPWELTSGGMELDPTKALFGGSPATETVVGAIPDKNAPPNEGARTKEVLTGLVDLVSGSTEQFINIGTSGIHSFNALPSAKSRPGEHTMQDLHGATPAETATNIQTKVIDPGKAISDKTLSAERAAHLYDKKIKEMLANESDEALRDELSKAAKTERPKTDLKPAEILAAVARASKEFDKKRARRAADKWKAAQKTPQEKADEWKLEQEKNGATVSTTALENKVREEQLAAVDEFRKKLAKMVDAFEKSTNDAMLSELANDLGSPQVLVADTNWGDERTHTFFVAMPDPTTGELRLWRKKEPGGELTPEDRKWIDTLWDKTE
ncbi:hypothetical protein QO034_19520 [Sedimentitalea sp. JM2-8]|uniref:Interaptin n=1 Tax=Sedimentitalea xiamensis TaxID=3050037 RepID=A0ABT7FJV9_9RHOB|nr:hypothetical protein [Sedimentitalea xiamensis]MDK3075275.1 hypothetical protein [Sedimentitalea xiamensis]